VQLGSADVDLFLGNEFTFLSSVSRRALVSRVPYDAEKLQKAFFGDELVCFLFPEPDG